VQEPEEEKKSPPPKKHDYRKKREEEVEDDPPRERRQKKPTKTEYVDPTLYMPNQEEYKRKGRHFSWYAEYYYGKWRKKDRIFVTPETVIPDPPKKPKPQPDESEYNKRQQDLDKELDDLFEKLVRLPISSCVEGKPREVQGEAAGAARAEGGPL